MTELTRTRSGPATPAPHMPSLGIWLAVFVLFFVLYALTAARGAQWQDSGAHILRVVEGRWEQPLGLALVHPLHHWLSRFSASFVPLEPCLAVTLVSAIAAGLAVANVLGCVVTLTGSRSAGLLAACSLGLAHTFWQMATVAETYTLTVALLTAECWCLAAFARTRNRTALCGMLLFNGLGLANHVLALLTAPVLLVVVGYTLRKKLIRLADVALAVGLWLLGSLPYTGLVVMEAVRSGEFVGTLRLALFGRNFADEVLNTAVEPRMLLIVVAFFVLSFPNLLLPAAGYGLTRWARLSIPVPARAALVAGLVIHVCFAVRYNVVDQQTFFLPTYAFLAIFGGVGFAAISRVTQVRVRRFIAAAAVVTLAATPVVYAFVPAIARRCEVLAGVDRDKPYRDDYVYLFTPWSVAERSADRMSREALRLAGLDGLILIEDSMAEFAVRYRAQQDDGGEVTVTSEITAGKIMQAVSQGRPVVLVPARVGAPRTEAPRGTWERRGELYLLVDSSTR